MVSLFAGAAIAAEVGLGMYEYLPSSDLGGSGPLRLWLAISIFGYSAALSIGILGMILGAVCGVLLGDWIVRVYDAVSG